MVENVKKNEFGFGVNNSPLWLFRIIDTQSKKYYNDQRWALLIDWYRKAEAYDMFVTLGLVPDTEDQPEQEEHIDEDKREPIKTFTKEY